MRQIDEAMDILYGKEKPEELEELYRLQLNTEPTIISRGSLDPVTQEKFYSDWLVVFPSGYITGCRSYTAAREIAIKYMRNQERNTKLFPYESPVWNWFGLSYSSYLVAPRAVLCAMPQEWQERFVGLLKELDETLDWKDSGAEYTVQKRDDQGRFTFDVFADYKYFDRSLIQDKRT